MPHGSEKFSITVDLTGEQRVVRLRGELDLAGVEMAGDALMGGAGATVVADLAGLSFIDARGVAALLSAQHRVKASGGRLSVVNVRDAVRRTMAIAGVDRVLLADSAGYGTGTARRAAAEIDADLLAGPSLPTPPERRRAESGSGFGRLPARPLSADVTRRVEGSVWFKTARRPYLMVDTGLRIIAVNAAYEKATGRSGDSLVGEWMFEAFPDNPADPHDAVASLSASFEEVFRHRNRHWMGVQRYDVPDRESGGFLYREWVPVNMPLLDDGRVVGAIHHVEDVTAVVADDLGRTRVEIAISARALASCFPTLPYRQVLGVLTEAHRDVVEAEGSPDSERATDLATTRLEMLAGHPRTAPPG